MKIFVINLKKRTDRRLSMETQLEREGLEYEIITAREPQDISKEEVSLNYNTGAVYQPNEIACSASHKTVYRKIIDQGIDKAMIMEDDVVLPHGFKKIIEKMNEGMGIDTDWLQIDYPSFGFGFLTSWLINYKRMFRLNFYYVVKFFIKFPAVCVFSVYEEIIKMYVRLFCKEGFKVCSSYRDMYFASCYIVTQKSAKMLHGAQTPISYTADRLPNVLKKDGFIVRALIPRLVYQDNEKFSSDLLINKVV